MTTDEFLRRQMLATHLSMAASPIDTATRITRSLGDNDGFAAKLEVLNSEIGDLARESYSRAYKGYPPDECGGEDND